jgi:GGDEF domain-containing protein
VLGSGRVKSEPAWVDGSREVARTRRITVTGVGTAKLRQAIEVQAAIASVSTDQQDALETTVREVLILVGASGAAVELAEGDELVLVAATGSVAHLLKGRRSLAGDLSGRCIRTGTAQGVRGVELEVGPIPGAAKGQGSVALVPLVRSEATLGVLTVWREGAPFDEDDIAVLAMVAEVAADSIGRAHPGPERDHSAGRDALTSLPDRSGLLDHLGRSLASLAQTSGTVAVLVIDLDGFGSLNRRFGYAAGDTVLEAVGARLAATVRKDDLVTRVGSDEFVIVSRLSAMAPVVADPVVPDAEPVTLGQAARSLGVERLTARAERAFVDPVGADGQLIRVSAAMGAATSDDPSESPVTLVARASAAMDRRRGLIPSRERGQATALA